MNSLRMSLNYSGGRQYADCAHYWAIDPPRARVSWGICKTCGERRGFSNIWPGDEGYTWKQERDQLRERMRRLGHEQETNEP
mgnify:CR=1 FL=1